MRKLLILCLVLCAGHYMKAQEKPRPRGYHQHDGFFLSMNWGPLFGNIKDNVKNADGSTAYTATFAGTGGMADFKLGWAVRENLLVHGTAILSAMAGPKITKTDGIHSASEQLPDKFELGERMLGAGMTYYFMPVNIFVSGSAGSGTFVISGSEGGANDGKTDSGFSMHFKVGKEFWISKNWGIGISFNYFRTHLTNQIPLEPEEKIKSGRYGILLSTTFN